MKPVVGWIETQLKFIKFGHRSVKMFVFHFFILLTMIMCISDSESGDYIVNSGACSSEDLNDMKYLVTNQQLTTGKVKHFFHYHIWTSIIFNQWCHIRILSIYAEETTFFVPWSASRVTNLCKDPWDWHRVGVGLLIVFVNDR